MAWRWIGLVSSAPCVGPAGVPGGWVCGDGWDSGGSVSTASPGMMTSGQQTSHVQPRATGASGAGTQ